MELPDYNCVLCYHTTEESVFHLLIGCPFATACWNWLGLQITHQGEMLHCLESFRGQLQVPFFMEIIIIMCWTIWQMRNGLIFNNRPPSLQQAKAKRGIQIRVCAAFVPHKTKLLSGSGIMVKQPCLICVLELIFFISFFVS